LSVKNMSTHISSNVAPSFSNESIRLKVNR
jgi:hypothetical protein